MLELLSVLVVVTVPVAVVVRWMKSHHVRLGLRGLLREGWARVGFGDDVSPADLQRRTLQRMLEAVPVGVAGVALAPTQVTVLLGPADYRTATSLQQWFCSGLASAFAERIRKSGRVVGGTRVRVDLAEDPDRPDGAPAVQADFSPLTTVDADGSVGLSAPMMPGVATLETATGRTFKLAPGFTIGRRQDCTLTLDDTKVSRKHLAFRGGPGRWTAVDLGSTNGTTVDGRRIARPTPVIDGSVIVLGSKSTFTLRDPAGAATQHGQEDGHG
jgi:hypothetical protein